MSTARPVRTQELSTAYVREIFKNLESGDGKGFFAEHALVNGDGAVVELHSGATTKTVSGSTTGIAGYVDL